MGELGAHRKPRRDDSEGYPTLPAQVVCISDGDAFARICVFGTVSVFLIRRLVFKLSFCQGDVSFFLSIVLIVKHIKLICDMRNACIVRESTRVEAYLLVVGNTWAELVIQYPTNPKIRYDRVPHRENIRR